MKSSFIALALTMASAAVASDTTFTGNIIHVANNGLDGPGCGLAASPCRSISAGINSAAEGDTVLVRPGTYGDLDLDGVLGSQGEESGVWAGMIYVNKRVTIISTGGADVTSLRGVDGLAVVHIDASGVQFGAKRAGFSISGGNSFGIATGPALATGKIAGNVLHSPTAGIHVQTDGLWEVSDNVVSGSQGSGIGIQSANDGTGSVLLHDNVIYGTESSTGIQVGPRAAHRIYSNSVQQAFYGIVVPPGLARVYQNTLTNNRIGLAIANYSGFGEPPTGTPVISRNNLIGNIGSGVVVLPSTTTGATLRENNLFGNGVCGLAGNGVAKIDARNNFWGAPTGPSFTQPADPICDDTNVRYQPFSTREFSIR